MILSFYGKVFDCGEMVPELQTNIYGDVQSDDDDYPQGELQPSISNPQDRI